MARRARGRERRGREGRGQRLGARRLDGRGGRRAPVDRCADRLGRPPADPPDDADPERPCARAARDGGARGGAARAARPAAADARAARRRVPGAARHRRDRGVAEPDLGNAPRRRGRRLRERHGLGAHRREASRPRRRGPRALRRRRVRAGPGRGSGRPLPRARDSRRARAGDRRSQGRRPGGRFRRRRVPERSGLREHQAGRGGRGARDRGRAGRPRSRDGGPAPASHPRAAPSRARGGGAPRPAGRGVRRDRADRRAPRGAARRVDRRRGHASGQARRAPRDPRRAGGRLRPCARGGRGRHVRAVRRTQSAGGGGSGLPGDRRSAPRRDRRPRRAPRAGRGRRHRGRRRIRRGDGLRVVGRRRISRPKLRRAPRRFRGRRGREARTRGARGVEASSMSRGLAGLVEASWSGKPGTVGWTRALAPAGALYGAASAHARRGAARSRRGVPGMTVIAVGNLTVGGTGKTSLAQWLASEAAKRGRAAVLLRGHGAGRGAARPAVVPDFAEYPLTLAAERCGDEAAAHRAALPTSVAVIVDRDRRAAALLAREGYGATVAVLDDGWEQGTLAWDRLWVTLEPESPAGNRLLLPAGPLRRPPETLREASVVAFILDGPGDVPPRTMEWTMRLSPSARIVRFRRVLVEVARPGSRHASSTRGFDSSAARVESGLPAGLLTGVGAPSRVEGFARASGFLVVSRASFPDHARVEPERLRAAMLQAARCGAEIILITAKDEYRWTLPDDPPLPVRVLRTGLAPLDPIDPFEAGAPAGSAPMPAALTP